MTVWLRSQASLPSFNFITLFIPAFYAESEIRCGTRINLDETGVWLFYPKTLNNTFTKH